MRIVHGYRGLGIERSANDRPAVTIGNFDGVHRGHQQVMRAVRDAARTRAASSVVCTFDPHTLRVVRPSEAPQLLQTTEQKLAAIAQQGIDLAIVIPFDRHMADTGRRTFVDDFLVAELGAGSLHVSSGFFFGRDREGRTAYLERRGAELGIEVERVDALIVDDAPVSSTRIRSLVAEGRVEVAATLLGRPYAVVGEVVRGEGRGDGLGAPTANLAVRNGCMPGAGVYVARAHHGDVVHAAVANVGRRPTFDGSGGVVVEAHLLDFEGALYGQEVELELLRRLRDERRFDDGAALAAQIRSDIETARAFFLGAQAP